MNIKMNNKKSSPILIDIVAWVFIIIFIGVSVLYTNDNPIVNVIHFRISFFLMILFGLIDKHFTKDNNSRNVLLAILGAFIILDFGMGVFK